MAKSLLRDLADLFVDEVTVEPVIGFDGTGAATGYGEGVVIKARVVSRHTLTRDSNGQERVSRVQAWLASGQVSVYDRFTLPARFGDARWPGSVEARQPPAIAVDSLSDENGAHHQKVFF